MLWGAVREGFLDELQKIGSVDLSGLSPETLLNQKPPEPMETVGSKKAMELLDRAQSRKLASAEKSQSVSDDVKSVLLGTNLPWPIRIAKMALLKKASVSSPAVQLRASQKVGEPVTNRAKKGPGFKQQIRGSLVGLKGALPPK